MGKGRAADYKMTITRKHLNQGKSCRNISTWLVLLVAIASTLLWTHPLAQRIGEAIPNGTHEAYGPESMDQMLSFWIVNEAGRRIFSNPLNIFDANIFYPLRDSLAYSESMLSAGAIVHPLRLLTGNPILAANLYFLASLIASFMGVFLLVREISHDDRAGIVAGLFFAFAGDRWLIPFHLPGQSVQYIPFIFLFCLRSIERPSLTNLGVLALLSFANTLGSVYYSLFTPLLLVPWAFVLMVARQGTLRNWGLTIAAVSTGVLAALPVFLPYLRVQQALPLYWRFPQAKTAWLTFAGAFREPLAYLDTLFTPAKDVFALSPLPILFGLSGLALAMAKPLSRAGFAKERVRIVGFLVMGLCGIILSLGAVMAIGAKIPGPFALISKLPGFSSMNETYRILIFSTFTGAVVMGAAIATMLRRIEKARWQNLVAFGCLVLISIDTGLLQGPWPVYGNFGPTHLPAAYRWLETTPKGTAIVELPLEPLAWEATTQSMIWSLYHDRPLMNGYSARFADFPHAVNLFPEEIGIETLQEAGVSYVFAHRDRMNSTPAGAQHLAEMERRKDLQPRWYADTLVLKVPPRVQTRPAMPRGRKLDNAKWSIRGAGVRSPLAADGDLTTYALVRKQENGSVLRVHLRREVRISAIRLRLGKRLYGLPQFYELYSSLDGIHWQKFSEDRVTVPPFASYREDPNDSVLDLLIKPTVARIIEIRVPLQYGGGGLPRWGVYEIEIYTDEPIEASRS